MLTVLSPAKSLDFGPAPVPATAPDWQEDAVRLATRARNLPLREFRALMDLSDDLARLNRDRFRAFAADPDPTATRPALFAFAGDTYRGFEARTLDAGGLAFAQERLRILSGLYGLLRPFDAIQPYRLEMGAPMKTRRGATLYEYWGDRIAKRLRDEALALGTDCLVNCASAEYFRAADRKALKLRVVTPVFLERKNGSGRIVSFFAKRARGAMARFVVDGRLTDPAALRDFSWGGYALDPGESSGDVLAFSRPYPDPLAKGGENLHKTHA